MTRDEEIIALHAEGVTTPEIGKRYGITRQRVLQIVSTTRPDRKVAKDLHRRILEAADGTLSVFEIAKATGASIPVVRYVVDTRGLTLPNHKHKEHARVREAIMSMAGPEATVKEIAASVGCSEQLVRNVAKEHAVKLSRRHAR